MPCAPWLSAVAIGVSRLTVSDLVHEKRGVSPDMALRLELMPGNGPGIWRRMQQSVDLWELENTKSRDYAAIERIAA